jgi:CO/xanthine dehydrogenase FAD-binding subunit
VNYINKRIFEGYRRTDQKPGELIKTISFHSLSTDTGSVFVKYGLRQSQAISVVMVAAVLKIRQGMITKVIMALGAVAPTIKVVEGQI